MKYTIEPSLLAIINKPKQQVIQMLDFISQNDIKYLHYDVIDNVFTKGTGFDSEYLQEITDHKLKINVHLMVQQPHRWLQKYFPYKVNCITFHPENLSFEEIEDLLDVIRNQKIKAGLAIKMGTNLEDYLFLANKIDYLTIMSVIPGKCGQAFDTHCYENLEKTKKFKEINPKLVVQLDGGIDIEIMKHYSIFANHFVLGSFFFKNFNLFKKDK